MYNLILDVKLDNFLQELETSLGTLVWIYTGENIYRSENTRSG